MTLGESAIDAVANNANSHIEMAMSFVMKEAPSFLQQDNDRLVKVARSADSTDYRALLYLFTRLNK